MPTVGTTSRPGYVYDQGTDTWIPIGVGPHSHDTSSLVPYSEFFVAGKNKIINGDMAINQRSFSSQVITNSTPIYGLDRWKVATDAGSGTCTYSVQQFTTGSAPVSGYEAQQFARVVTSGQTLSTTYALFIQSIEDVRTLAGQTATISFWAKAASGTPKISVEIEQVNIGGAAPRKYMGQVTIGTTWSRYSVTNTVPSISGAVGTNSKLEINFWVSGGSTFNALNGSLGLQSNTFDFWGVQVEAGNVATPFTTATGTIQGELAACQRYYWRQTGPGAFSTFALGYAQNSTIAWFSIQNPVVMRATPSSIDFSNLATTFHGVVANAISNLVFGTGTASPYLSVVQATTTGLTTNLPYNLTTNNNTAGFIGFSAEL